MLDSVVYLPILGKPLIMYLGILTLLGFLATGYTGARKMAVELHTNLAKISIVLAIVHAIMGILAYF